MYHLMIELDAAEEKGIFFLYIIVTNFFFSFSFFTLVFMSSVNRLCSRSAIKSVTV